jgi:hypothetical protein
MKKQNSMLEAQIAAHQQMLSSEDYSRELETYTEAYAEKLRLEEEQRHQESILKYQRDAAETKARINAHQAHITHGHPNANKMKKQTDEEVEKAARLQIEEEKQKEERLRLEDQRNVIHSIRRDSYQKGIKLRQLTAANELLDRQHRDEFEREVTDTHKTIAEREIQIEHREEVHRLTKEKRDSELQLQRANARIEYIRSDEFLRNSQLSAALALETQKKQEVANEVHELSEQLRANTVANISSDLAALAEEKNIPLEDFMRNITPYLAEIERRGISKLDAMRTANATIKETQETRTREVARRQSILDQVEKFGQEELGKEVLDNVYTDGYNHCFEELDDADDVIHRWDKDRFDNLISTYEHSIQERAGKSKKFKRY